jgi:flap endonuclease-1
MGVKLLGKLLKTQCYDVSKQKHLSYLYGKKICIDVSIYLYRYKSQDSLIENFYLMCTLFKHYNITPLFVFDGKPPQEKKKELDRRRRNRKEAYEKYDELVNKFGENMSKEQKAELQDLKRKITKINNDDIKIVQDLFDAYGIKYVTAKGEADVLCASLVLKKKVYAVLTEDMDLFAYTCPIVLRYFSLSNHTVVLYDLKKILTKLDIDKNNFQTVCVLSGNDYYDSKKNIFSYLKLFNRYKKSGGTTINVVEPSCKGCKKCKKQIDFIEWLKENKYLNDDEILEITNILNIYKNVKNELVNYNYIVMKNGYVDRTKLYEILERERFIF